MHIVGLVDRIDHVCCRYRLRGYEPIWRRAGHSLELLTWDRSWWARCHPGAGLRHADVVVILRKLLPRWQLGLLRRAVRRLVFDFDDAVFLRDSYDRRGTHCPRRRRRFAAAVHASDAVVAGNSFLAAAALQTSGPGRVHVIPTCVEPERYPLAEHRSAGDAVSLVWVGSRSTLQGLEWIRPLLNQVGRACPGVRLKLICDTFLSFEALPTVACRWSEATEAAEIARGDIGVSWLPDDLWSRGK
ncbi:MAG: hypothetical protein RMJ52_17675 [Gemmataceae bacterium]|nr:hypothetical protein [Gemmataceae bacterium]